MQFLQTEIVRHRHGAKSRRIAAAEVSINIVLAQAGIFQCTFRAFRMELCRRLVGRVTGRVFESTHYVSLAVDAHAGFRNGWGLKALQVGAEGINLTDGRTLGVATPV